MLSTDIRHFLSKKLKKHKLSKKDFSQLSNISYRVVCNLINEERPSPELYTITKIADVFNCQIDQILNRKQFIDNTLEIKIGLTEDFLMLHLKQYIQDQLIARSIKPIKLGREIGFSIISISEFVKPNSKQKKLGTSIILALANYFNVSIDFMVGRI